MDSRDSNSPFLQQNFGEEGADSPSNPLGTQISPGDAASQFTQYPPAQYGGQIQQQPTPTPNGQFSPSQPQSVYYPQSSMTGQHCSGQSSILSTPPPNSRIQPSVISPNPAQKKPGGRKFLVLLILCLIAVLLLVLGLCFVFRDSIFGSRSYASGVKTAWKIDLPKAEGRRYVEPVSDDKLMLVDVKEERKATVSYISLPERDKPTAQPAAVKDLPKCNLSVERPFIVKEGKIICNDSRVKVFKTAEINGLTDNARANLGKELRVVSQNDTGTLLNTAPGSSVSALVFIDTDRKVLWERTFTSPVEASAGDDSIWVADGNQLTKLVAATKEESERETVAAKQALDKIPLKEYCVPEGNICFNYPADYKITEEKESSGPHIKVSVYNLRGKQVAFIGEFKNLGMGGSCDPSWYEGEPKNEVIDVRETRLKGLTKSQGHTSEAKVITELKYDLKRGYRITGYITNASEYQKIGKLEPCSYNWGFSTVIDSKNLGIYDTATFHAGEEENESIKPIDYYPDVESAKAALKNKPEYEEGTKILQTLHFKNE